MLRCNLTKSRELELIILMSLMTLLDKSDDGGWKKDSISKGVKEDMIGGYNSNVSTEHNSNSNNNSDVLPFTYEDPIPKKSLQKKYKVELLNDQKLQTMLEKDVRRSQKQIQSDQKNKPLSAGNSPSHTPKGSPLPTPSVSTNNSVITDSPRLLTRQKSAANLSYYQDSSISNDISNTKGTNKNNNNGGKLSRIFSSLSHPKQINVVSSSTATPSESKNTSPVENNSKLPSVYKSNDTLPATNHNKSTHQNNNYNNNNSSDQKYQKKQQKQQQQQQQRPHQYDHPSYYDNQHSLPTGQLSRFSNDFGNLTLNSHYESNPASVRSIRWNPEPLLTPSQTSAPIITSNTYLKRTPSGRQQQQPIITSQQISHRSQSQDRRRPIVLDERSRRMSASEYPMYAYHPHSQHQQQHYGYIQPTTNNYNNRYSTSEYYAYQQQQHQYDYYQ